MNKKIKSLALLSYDNCQLDANAIDLISSRLNRRELKDYIRFLKQIENEKQVIVTVPKQLENKDKEKIQLLFPDKTIIYLTDPEMISGIKITNGDVEYEISINQIFHDIINHISKYD